jgi:hypothetical protein
VLLADSALRGDVGARATLHACAVVGWRLGYDCGYEAFVFMSCYEDEPDYVEGFVETVSTSSRRKRRRVSPRGRDCRVVPQSVATPECHRRRSASWSSSL